MRVRKRKGAQEHLENNPHYVILEPEAAKGRWCEVFGNDHPIHIEVGSGKGAFITGMALKNPEINYIGIDIQLSVLSYALDKVLASQAPNVRLLRLMGQAWPIISMPVRLIWCIWIFQILGPKAGMKSVD